MKRIAYLAPATVVFLSCAPAMAGDVGVSVGLGDTIGASVGVGTSNGASVGASVDTGLTGGVGVGVSAGGVGVGVGIDVDNPAGQSGRTTGANDDPIVVLLRGLVGEPLYSADNVELGVIKKVEENEDRSVFLVIDLNDALDLGVNRVSWRAMPDKSWSDQVSTQLSYAEFANVVRKSRRKS